MSLAVEKKFAVEVTYNGITKSLEVDPEERVSAVLQRAIAEFKITQAPHLLGLFREDGTVLPDNESVERAGIKPKEVLLLRPDAVRGGNGPLRLGKDVILSSFRTLRNCGSGKFECAVFWTGPASGDLVDGVEHPIHKRSPFGYEVNSDWLTTLWRQLAANKRSVKAQVHTHPGQAFHSTTDNQWPIVSQVGFVSIVIPEFAAGVPSLDDAWVGRLGEDGEWRRAASQAEVLVYA